MILTNRENAIEVDELQRIAHDLRIKIIDMIYKAGSGHLGGSLSLCEILTVLYFAEMRVDPCNPSDPNRDRFILSKGHAAPALYAALARKGYFPVAELDRLRKIGSKLQGHPDMRKVPGVEMSSGSLGMGISFGIGTALAAKFDGLSYRTYVITGCGELDEGQNWEALMMGAKHGLDNLAVIVDYNGIQLDGSNEMIMPLGNLAQKLAAFDWHVAQCNGHDIPALLQTLKKIKTVKHQPSVILAHTIKGKGISFMENSHEWHGKELHTADYRQAMAELKGICNHE
jgi:transketolase